MKTRSAVIITVLFLFAGLSSCGKKEPARQAPESARQTETVQTEAVTETEDLSPVEVPEYTEAMDTFFSGDVAVRDGSDWIDIEIGDFLKEDDVLRVGEASYCELQFGETAVVRVQEDTEVAMKNIALTPGEASIALKMQKGSVLCKVQKLAGKEQFKVQTQTAVCGVRGTQFAVESGADKKTVLAVKEGAVAVLPASVDVDSLKEQVGESSTQLLDILDEIEKSAPVVQANQEIDLDENTLKQTEVVMQEVKQAVEEIVETAKQAQPEEDQEQAPVIREIPRESLLLLTKAVEKTKQEVAVKVTPPKEISEVSRRKMEKIDTMKMIEIPKAPAEAAEQEAEAAAASPAPKLLKVSLQTDPPDAAITLNSARMGTGRFSGIYNEGEILAFQITRDGFRDYRLNITVSEDTGKLYKVKLAPVPPVKKEEEARKTEPEKPQKVKIEVKTDPGDSEIFLGGRKVGEGSFTGTYNPGSKLSFILRKEGFEEKTLNVTAEEGGKNVFKASLTKIPEPEKAAEPEPAPAVKEDAPEREPVQPEITEAEPESAAEPQTIISSLAVTVFPPDADIYINGMKSGRGSFRGEYQEGTTVSVRIERGGYLPRTEGLTIGTSDIRKTYTLKPKTIQYDSAVTAGKITGRITYGDGDVYIADSSGVVTAADMEGKKIWSVSTSNSPNENSYPVLTGKTLYFSGSKELVIINAASGAVISRTALDADSAHLFGRRVIQAGSDIIFPANETLNRIDPRTGEPLGEINIPGGSRMTPAEWKGNLIIVNQQGTMFIIDPEGKNPVRAEVSTAAVQPVALAPAIVNNFAVFSGRKGTVVCVDLSAQKVLWERKLPGSTSVFTDIACSGTGIFVFSKGTVYSLSLRTGNDLFPPISGASSPPLCTGGMLYFGSEQSLEIRDSSDGSLERSIDTGRLITTRPEAAGSKILAGTEDGHILIINP